MVELKGEDGLSSIVLDREHNGSKELAVHGVFIEIGAHPRVEPANHLRVALNDEDGIVTDKHGHTSVKGVLAASDVTNASGDLKQPITAAAQGAAAATSAYEYVSEHGNACEIHAMDFSLA